MSKYNSYKVAFNLKTDKTVSVEYARNNLDSRDRIIFDSKLEFTVYQKLRNFFSPSQIECHKHILISPKSAFFPATHWCCDFVVNTRHLSDKTPNIIVEAKGIVTRDFKYQLQLLGTHFPARLRDLVIIGYNKTKLEKSIKCSPMVNIINHDDMEHYFSSLIKQMA